MKVKLGDLTKIRTGKLDANAASENGKYPFFTCSKEPLRISTYSYDCECVLVAGNGDLNTKYYNGKFDAYQRTYIIESNSDRRLYLPYLYYFMTRYIQDLRRLSIGGVIKYIKLSNLTDAEISLPDIEEQKVACKKLEKVKNIIDKKESQLFYLDSLIKARFVEMFKDEDPVFAFDDVLIDDTKNGFKLDSSNYSNLGKIAIVDQGQKRICGYINAVDGKAPWSKEAIIFGDHTEMFKYTNFPFYLGADGAKLLSPKNGWNARFLYHYLDVNYHKRLGYMRHFKYLKEMSFIKPDLYRQEEFCMFCTQVDKSKFALQNSIKSLMNLWYNINNMFCERTYGEA